MFHKVGWQRELGGTFNKRFTAKLLENRPVKKLCKSVKIWQWYQYQYHLFAQINWTRRTHDQHENKSRTRKAQKTGAYISSIKNKHTRYKNNYDYAYRKNAEKSTWLSDRLNFDNVESQRYEAKSSKHL